MLGSKLNQTEDMTIAGSQGRLKPLYTFQLTQSYLSASNLSVVHTSTKRGQLLNCYQIAFNWWFHTWAYNKLLYAYGFTWPIIQWWKRAKSDFSQCLHWENDQNKFQHGVMPLQPAIWAREFYKHNILYTGYLQSPSRKMASFWV